MFKELAVQAAGEKTGVRSQEVWWPTQSEVPAHWERRLGCLEQALHLDKPYQSSLGSIKGPQ